MAENHRPVLLFYSIRESERRIKNKLHCRDKKSGYYYVDKDGVRTDSAEMNAAVQYVRSHTKQGWTAMQKLEACYQALRDSYTYRHFDGVPKGAGLSECACSLFSDGR